MKRIAIFGSTGSIGRQTLQVVESFPDRFRIVGLAAGRNAVLLAEQVKRFGVRCAWVQDSPTAMRLTEQFRRDGYKDCQVLHSHETVETFLERSDPDVVVSAISGQAGLYPTYCSAKAGLDIALANKESLVMMGPLLMQMVQQKGSRLTPVDSEHSAIMQCLAGEARESVRRLILTASGGPFRRDTMAQLQKRSFRETQRHPVWNMGEKINVDSATLMNKGLEVIEACALFDRSPDEVDVLVHPESIVHSMVEFVDGSWKAQIAVPNMELPILYSLSAPQRFDWETRGLTPEQLSSLHFERVDRLRFRCLDIAYEAVRAGGSMPSVLCTADEIAIEYFRNGTISFTEIPEVIEATMRQHHVVSIESLESILAVKKWTTQVAENEARKLADKR
ncbi:MAG: 1-deoxy-D-xylulose-5-phosphate reductoisomerase [Candidatus Coatesbacteria bacterium]|nr:MAG: 1-deoxy-D-xylulose-5-phosphate reductoisomerase [Candidatus Coatesbacteria bacterium]